MGIRPLGKFILLRGATGAQMKLLRRQTHDAPPIQEESEAEFYRDYRRVAEDCDKEFLNKCGEDLNNTLIFVSSAWSC